MASPVIAKELQAAIRFALADARRRKHEYLTLEHLLLGMVRDPRVVEVLRACRGDTARIGAALESVLEGYEGTGAGEPQQTIGVERVLQRAAFHALSTASKFMDGADVLVAIFREDESAALRVLKSEGIGRLDVLNFIAHGITKSADDVPEAAPPSITRPRLPLLTDENALSQHRRKLERNGAKIIDLTISNPTVVGLSPLGVSLPAVDVYQPDPLGLSAARESIGRYAGTSDLILSASTSEAYAWLFKLLGGEVLVPAPCYPLLDYLAELEGVSLRSYPLRYDGRWCVDLPLIEASPRTKGLIAISPGNPTGTYLSAEEADALAKLCAEHQWALIIDEVFAEAGRNLRRSDWPCLTFTLGGLSKVCGLPQLKLAWTGVHGLGAGAALDRLGFIADNFLSVSSPVQAAAGSLLELAAPFQQRVRERCTINRAATRLPPDWQLLASDAGWSAVLRVPEGVDEETRCLELLDRGVALHPGYFYDFPAGAHLVVSLLPDPAEYAEAMRRLA